VIQGQFRDLDSTWTVHDKHTDAPSILAVDARARKIEYEPALLDTQADDVHATLGGLPASTIDVTPPQRPRSQTGLRKRPQGAPLSRKRALAASWAVIVAGRAFPWRGAPFPTQPHAARSRRQPLPQACGVSPLSSAIWASHPPFRRGG